jgi:hypothetical protein
LEEGKMTEAEKFSSLVTGVLKVPHSEIKAKLEEERKRKKRRKRAKTSRASRVSGASD